MQVELSQDELTEIIAALELLSQWENNDWWEGVCIENISRGTLVDHYDLLIRLKMY